MISNLDLLRTAQLMLTEFGDEAAIECTVRATVCLENGDHKGHRLWLEVIRALGVLERRDGDQLH
jgi:hypothetical protein